MKQAKQQKYFAQKVYAHCWTDTLVQFVQKNPAFELNNVFTVKKFDQPYGRQKGAT